MEVKSLYEKEHYDNLVERAGKISSDSTPMWGKMNAAQMFTHCTAVQEVMNGKPTNVPWYMKFFSGFIKKMITNTKPYKKDLPTAPDYIKTGEHDFEKERTAFLEAISVFYKKEDQKPHPVFGEMTDLERGWAMYKHHDHHLQQFGV